MTPEQNTTNGAKVVVPTREQRARWSDLVRRTAPNTLLGGIIVELIAALEHVEAERDADRQCIGVLWTLIANIREPIRKCFIDRTISFPEFSEIAVSWAKSVVRQGHPDHLRAERDSLRSQLAEMTKANEGLRESLADTHCRNSHEKD